MVPFKKLWLLSLLLIILSTSATAFTIKTSLDASTKVISRDGTASFTLNVSHNSPQTQILELFTSDVSWDLSTNPSTDRTLTVPTGETVTTTVLLRPIYAYPGSYYVVPITVKSSGGLDSTTLNPQVGVLSGNTPGGLYSPSLGVRIDSTESIDPTKEVIIRVTLDNLNKKDLSQVDIKLRSKIFNQDYSTALKGLEKKSVSLKITIDPLTPPQDDVLRVTVFVPDPVNPQQFDALPLEVAIIPHGDLSFEPLKEKAFLERITRIKVTNNGNVARVATYTIPGGLLKSIFSKGVPKYERRTINEEKVFAWDVSLEVGEKKEIVLITNYRTPVFLLILIMLGIIAYYKFRSPITITKSAFVVSTREGGISEFKVLLEIKNRNPKPLKNVNILDSMPHMVDVTKDFEAGSLHPISIMKHGTGTLLKWAVDDLDGYEERVITYKIRSKLSILGSLTLPVAIAKFDTPFGHKRSTASNTAHLALSSHKGKVFK
ncbi:hypothetical protein HY483_00430 [Candidatus Woesearchaeota archaeon]|nr:hypothetical protein [Candidatus Woesearchaeota archaeon]